MKKVIACKPITELELQFQGGEIINLRFDIEAAMAFDQLDGGINGILEKGAKMTEICAKIIYAGAIGGGNEITLEKAREYVCQMSISTITDIVNEFTKSMETEENEAVKEFSKKKLMELAAKR